MAAATQWVVEWVKCKPVDGEYTDVVVTAGWRCNGVDGDHSGSVYSTCSFPAPEGSFTPYSQLTQDQILGWIWASGVDKDAAEAAVQQQINDQINPPITQPPLPWSQNAA